MPSVTEQRLHELQTETFISYRPVELEIRRKNWIDDGAGGKKLGVPPEESLDPQRVRVVGHRRPPVRVIDGVEVQIDKSVVGMPGFDVQLLDTFTHKDYEYTVVNIQDEPDWRVTAEARRSG